MATRGMSTPSRTSIRRTRYAFGVFLPSIRTPAEAVCGVDTRRASSSATTPNPVTPGGVDRARGSRSHRAVKRKGRTMGIRRARDALVGAVSGGMYLPAVEGSGIVGRLMGGP